MKIVYMGTPEFAVYPLEKLIGSSHEVGYVVCQPDMAKDRGKKVKFSPVKEVALKNQIRVLQPEKIKNNEEFINELRQYSPDLIDASKTGVHQYSRLHLAEMEGGCTHTEGDYGRR